MSLISKLFIAFQMMDCATTFIGLVMFVDMFMEGNPFVPIVGWVGLIIFKIIITVALVWLTEFTEWYTPMKFATIFSALIVVSNAVQILIVAL